MSEAWLARRRALALAAVLLTVGVVITALLADSASTAAREVVVSSLRAEAANRLLRWETANEDAVRGLMRFADAFTGRENRTHPVAAAAFRRMALRLAFTGDGREVVSAVSVWVYVSNEEREEWEAGLSGPIMAPPLEGPPVPPTRLADEQDYYLVIRQGYPNPGGPTTGADYSRRLPERFAAIERCIAEKRPTATAPQLLARASGLVVGIPFQVPILSVDESVRPVWGVVGVRILDTLLTSGVLENNTAGIDVATFSSVADVTDDAAPILIGENPPLDNSSTIALAEVVSDVAARRWKASVSTTEDAVAERRDTAPETTTWVIGLLASLVAALAAVAGAELRQRRRREELMRFTSVVTSATHDRVMTAVSHELRNPLTGVWAGVEFFLESYGASMSSEMRKDLQVVISCARTMQRVLDDMLDAQRLQHGDVAFKLRAARLDVLARDVRNMMRAFLPAEVSLAIIADEGLPPALQIDSLRVRQIVVSAVANACRHAAAGTVIELWLSVCEDFLVVQVLNVGKPLPRGSSELTLFGKTSQHDHQLPPQVLAFVSAAKPADCCTRERVARLADAVVVTHLTDSAAGSDSAASTPSSSVATAAAKAGATGSTLGLALSFSVATGMGGSIGLRNVVLPPVGDDTAPRSGVHFWLAIPAPAFSPGRGSAAADVDEGDRDDAMLGSEMHAGTARTPTSPRGSTDGSAEVEVPSTTPSVGGDEHRAASDVAVSIEDGGAAPEPKAHVSGVEAKYDETGSAAAEVPMAVDVDADAVVVVDDEAVIRRIAGRIITKLGGRVVASLHDGANLPSDLEALERPPSCVLLDIVMLRSNGIEVLQRLREHEKWRPLPVYAMTSNVERSSVEKYKSVGFTGVVGKPFTAAMIGRALEHAHAPADARAPFLEQLAP